jgi:hypothetical protein
MIFPSAGETIIFSRDGIFRLGFLKKKPINSVMKIPKKVNKFQPIVRKNTVTRAKGIRKGNPSLAIGQRFRFINLSSP